MKKTLTQFKIELSSDKKHICVYARKRSFLFFKQWVSYGSMGSNVEISQDKLDKINDETIASMLIRKFL